MFNAENVIASPEVDDRKILLVDADSFAYKMAYMSKVNSWSFQQTCVELDKMWLTLANATNTGDYVAFMTNSVGQFREIIKPDYKASRKLIKSDDIMNFLPELKNYVWKRFKCNKLTGVEADDGVGILLSQYPNAIVCSDDGDLLQMEGVHYNIRYKTFTVTDELGFLYLKESGKNKTKKIAGSGEKIKWSMMLTGDKDECAGLPKVGSVKSFSILNGLNTKYACRNKVLECYLNHYGYDEGLKKFHDNYRLLHVIRKTRHRDLHELSVHNIYNILSHEHIDSGNTTPESKEDEDIRLPF